MTDHIKEAVARLKQLRKVGFGYDIKDEDRAAIDAVLSALAAAEERGRMAERDRCDEIVRAAWGQNVTIGFLSEAITKEPTHTNPQRNNYVERYDGID